MQFGNLKHHAVERLGAQPKKRRGKTIGDFIELAVSHAPLRSRESQALGIVRKRLAHRFRERPDRESVVCDKSRKGRRRRINDTGNRFTHTNPIRACIHPVLPQPLFQILRPLDRR